MEDASQKHTAHIKAETEGDATSGHTCGVCGRSFPLLSSLSQHMRRHTREKPYKCPYCEHRTAQKGSLKAHVRSHKLGLLSHNISDKEGDAHQGQGDDADAHDPPEVTSGKAHNVNGKVKKKGTKKKVKRKGGGEDGDEADAAPFSCTICGQAFPQVLLLKTHMKRHRGSQDHGCRICGRRFRQAWFLQSHMRIHRVKGQLCGSKSNDLPATINGVPQDPASLTNEECLYELCAGCGNFFFDRKTLRIHELLHKLNHSSGQDQNAPNGDPQASEPHMDKRRFLESLNLTCAGQTDTREEKGPGRRIPELDPVCSYQAWQLATRGRLAEASEKCLGWEERLADAEVAYDMEKGEYVPLKQEKKRKQIDTAAPILSSLHPVFFPPDNKSYFCDHCDFHTVDASLLRSHLLRQHQDFLGPFSKQTVVVDSVGKIGSKASRYMDYLRSRSALLSQPYWNPYTCPPSQLVDSNIKLEKSNGTEVKGQGHAAVEAGSLLNLSSLPIADKDGDVSFSVKTEGLVRHQCPYCSHTTTYPEVLWIHQRVAHRVDSSSSAAPKWAPSLNPLKSLKAGASQWRRTGPPPFLEGKDCPALHAPRAQRTQPPGCTVPGSSKQPTPKTQSGTLKSKHHSKDPRSSDRTQSSTKAGLQPQKKSGEHRAAECGSKSSSVQPTSSHSVSHSKSLQSTTISPKQQSSNRVTVEGNFPQEGLGFMLSRNHGATSSSPKGPDLWAAINMWGLHGSKAFLDPLLFAQGKSGSAGEMPMDIDILSLLKNYSPHELAALYQHWGFVDPRLDPQGELKWYFVGLYLIRRSEDDHNYQKIP
uniref:Zinc finger protein 516 n=1 Tax=Salarias fasciatus TaxID=181472 RepID=A0A672HN34_SALFA